MSNNRHYWRLLEVGVVFVCMFEQRACLVANFNAARSIVANHEVRLSRLSIGRSSPTLELR